MAGRVLRPVSSNFDRAMKFLEQLFLRRPRVLNFLHAVRLAKPTSQTTEVELKALEKYAREARAALEIGSSQGVSAARIAAALPDECLLYCVDPWPPSNGNVNPCYSVFARHIHRAGLTSKVRVLQKVSAEVRDLLPDQLDFIFVDGDHSWAGVEADWNLVRNKLRIGGIVCLHDSLVPPDEPRRQPDSVRFYNEIISADGHFRTIDQIHSLAVLSKIR
jgi:predicted O-methyltransferase YrrM